MKEIITEQSALLEFELYVREGKYQELKKLKSFLKQAKSYLRKEFYELPGKRYVFDSVNMVVKFVTKEEKETNHPGLIADALDYVRLEKLVPLLTLNYEMIKKDELEKEITPFLLPKTYYIRPTLNKVGKSYLQESEYLFGGQTTVELLAEIRAVTEELEQATKEYEKLKESLSLLPQFQEKKKLSVSVGSISYLANKPAWDMEQIAEKFGEDFIIRYGKVNVSLLDEWVLSGKFPKSIVNKNRTVIDLRSDFVVMSLDSEAKSFNFRNNKRTKLSLQRYA